MECTNPHTTDSNEHPMRCTKAPRHGGKCANGPISWDSYHGMLRYRGVAVTSEYAHTVLRQTVR
jgi:hypothetical protein